MENIDATVTNQTSLRKYFLKTKIGVLIVSCVSMSALAITPSYAAIAQNFALDNTSVQLLTSFPNLFMMLAGLLMGKLTTTKINFKALTLTMIAFTCVGGLAPLLWHTNFYFLLFCSCLVGLGQGACTNLSQVLITRLLPKKEHQSAMGLTSTFTNIGGIIFIMGGGQLAARNNWVNNYWIYLFAVLVLIVAAILIPLHPRYTDKGSLRKKTNPKIKLNRYVFYSALWAFFTMLLNNVLNNNIAIFINKEKLGSTSQAALASTISLVGGMLCGLIVGQIGKKFKHSSIALSFLLYAVAYAIIGLSNSLVGAFIGSFVAGAGMSIAMGQFAFLITQVTNTKSVSIALGVYQAINPIGGVLSPFLVNPLVNLFHVNVFVVGSLIALLIAVLVLITKYQRNLTNYKVE